MIFMKKAFTLIELLLIIAVIGLLTAFIVINLGESRSMASDSKRKTDISNLYTSILGRGTIEGAYPEMAAEIRNGQVPEDLGVYINQFLKAVPDSINPYFYLSDGKDFAVGTILGDSSCFIKSTNPSLFGESACDSFRTAGIGLVQNFMMLHGSISYDLSWSIPTSLLVLPTSKVSSAIVCIVSENELSSFPSDTELLSTGELVALVNNAYASYRITVDNPDRYYYCKTYSYDNTVVTVPGSIGSSPNTSAGGFSSSSLYYSAIPSSYIQTSSIEPPNLDGTRTVGGSTSASFSISEYRDPDGTGNISLSWVPGYLSTHTLIRRTEGDTYDPSIAPKNVSEGVVVYDKTNDRNGDDGYVDPGVEHILVDGNLNPDKYYCYSAWAYVVNSDLSKTYSNGYVLACGSVPLSALSNPVISATTNSFSLSWVKGSGNSTVIRRMIGSSPETIDQGTLIYSGEGSSFIDSDPSLQKGVTYCYSLWSYDTALQSLSEDKVSVCSELFPLGNPSGLSLNGATSSSVNLFWIAGENSTSSVIRRQVGTSPTDRTQGTQVYFGADTSYTDENLPSETNYCYSVWGYDSSTDSYSEGYVSNCLSTLPLSGTEVVSVTTATDTNISINFTKGVGATNTIVRRQIGTAPLTRTEGVLVYDGTDSSFLDSDLVPATEYCYSFWSYNSNNGSYSSSSTACYRTKPSSVSGFNITDIGYTSMSLSFSKGVGSTSTIIRRQTDIAPMELTDGLSVYSGSEELFADNGLMQGTRYCYSAWSYDGVNYSDSKISICGDTILVGVPQDISHSNLTQNSSSLSFTKGVGTSHTVIRRQIGSAPLNREEGIEVYRGIASSIDESGLIPSTEYCYSLWGYDSNSDSYSLTYNFYCVETGEVNHPTSITTSGVGYTSGTISFVKGIGSDSTIIRRWLNRPPNRNEGEQVYNGIGQSFNDTGLWNLTKYCYSLWGYDSGSNTYSDEWGSVCFQTASPDGICGPANGINSLTMPTEGLCDNGIYETMMSMPESLVWSWGCRGVDGGSDATCSANKILNGVCGYADGGSTINPPTFDLCNTGNPSIVSTGTLFTWTCYGSGGGNNVECSSIDIIRGTGKDGALSISPASATTYNLNTTTNWPSVTTAPGVYFQVTENRAAGTSQIVINSSTGAGLSIGDEVLIINLQGTSSNNANVGKYETARITAITPNSPSGKTTLTFKSSLINGYDGTTQKIMVQRIPNWTNVTVGANATITANAFNGNIGGVVAFRSSGTLTISGIVNMDSKGFRGATVNGRGACGYPWPTVAGDRGESYAGNNTVVATSRCASVLGNRVALTPSAGGGGGGAGSTSSGRGGGGGGAGSYGSAGTAGATSSYSEPGGAAGATYGTANLSKIYLGSGAGESGSTVNTGNTPGGNGGGIIMVYGNTINSTGTITARGANGSAGGTTGSDDCWGGGGGGAGGSVMIYGKALSVGTKNYAGGGSGGVGSTNGWGGTCGAGGAGGNGRIAFRYLNAVSGSATPASNNSVITGY
ncbi:hypothetical protein MNSC_12340 [Minisyncoccus archaeophilus]